MPYGAKHATLLSYTMGFAVSIILTLAAFLIVAMYVDTDNAVFSRQFVVIAVIDLAVSQLIVQAVFFLHLSGRSSARWNLIVFAFTALIVFTVVAGSLWIMNNLNYNMTPSELETYMDSQN